MTVADVMGQLAGVVVGAGIVWVTMWIVERQKR